MYAPRRRARHCPEVGCRAGRPSSVRSGTSFHAGHGLPVAESELGLYFSALWPQSGLAMGAGRDEASDGQSDRLKLSDVCRVFRLVGEIREIGADPERWRPHMVQALRRLANADVVVSSEIHFRKIKTTGVMKVFDLGWGSDPEGQAWKIHTEREDERPENFWLAAMTSDKATTADDAGGDEE